MPTTGSPVRLSTQINLSGRQIPGDSAAATQTLSQITASVPVQSGAMSTSLLSTSLLDHIRGSWRILVKEDVAFGIVGFISLGIDLGIYNLLLAHSVGVLTAKTISTIVATTFAYFGNLYFSFSHRARTSLGRETSFFFGINVVALLGGLAILALFAYPLHLKYDHFAMNVVNLFTIGLGTLFRFWAYKQFVFLHPDRVAAGLPDDDDELDEDAFISAS
jgi:putative flippase GtrA